MENHSESSGCTNSCNKLVSSRFVDNEMTHDVVTKRYQCPRYERAGGQCSVIFRRSPVSLVISLCWLNLTSQCLDWHVFYTSAIRNAFSVHGCEFRPRQCPSVSTEPWLKNTDLTGSVHSSLACLPTCLIVIRIDYLYIQKFQKVPRHTVWEPLLQTLVKKTTVKSSGS